MRSRPRGRSARSTPPPSSTPTPPRSSRGCTTYIDGPNLAQLVARGGPLGSGAVLTLAAGLAEGLASIHGVGLIHRDLKPANVVLDDLGPHIIDFGIALTPDATRLTASVLMGTPSYVAPEVIQGVEPGGPADVFALGATLVFASSGKHLVTEGTMHAQMLQISAGRFDLSAVPRELRPLVVRCTSANPRERPTADELARILVASGVSPAAPGWYSSPATAPPVILPPLPATRISRRSLFAVGGVVGVAVVGAGAAAWAGVFNADPAATTAGPPGPTTTLASPTSTPAGPTAAATPDSGYGSLVWQARSGATPVSPSPSARQSPTRIMIHRGERLITANESQVFAVGLDGKPQWQRPLETGLVNLWPWGDAVVVTDARQLWILDAKTGARRFVINVADHEERDSRGDNPDKLPVQIGGVAIATDAAYVGLGTATIALSRSGRTVWRRARPDARNGIRPPAGVPVATRGRWLVTHDPSGSVVDLGLRDVADGELQWLKQYEPTAATPPPQGPGGPPMDESWTRSEGRIGKAHVVIREVQEVRVVSLTTGATVWRQVSETPIAGMELVGDTVLVAADRLRAYAVATGAELWQVPQRGARVAVAPDGAGVVVASEQGLAAINLQGVTRWQRTYPPAVADAVADRITAVGNLAYCHVPAERRAARAAAGRRHRGGVGRPRVAELRYPGAGESSAHREVRCASRPDHAWSRPRARGRRRRPLPRHSLCREPDRSARFREPQAPPPWTEVRDAVAFGPTPPKPAYLSADRRAAARDRGARRGLALGQRLDADRAPAGCRSWCGSTVEHSATATRRIAVYDGTPFARDGVVFVSSTTGSAWTASPTSRARRQSGAARPDRRAASGCATTSRPSAATRPSDAGRRVGRRDEHHDASGHAARPRAVREGDHPERRGPGGGRRRDAALSRTAGRGRSRASTPPPQRWPRSARGLGRGPGHGLG